MTDHTTDVSPQRQPENPWALTVPGNINSATTEKLQMTIDLQQPQPFDLVSNQIQAAGQAVTFEANIQWQVGLGTSQVSGFFQGGGGVSVLQFQTTVDVGGLAADVDAGVIAHLTLFEESPADGSVAFATSTPIILAERLFADYEGWQPYTIQTGDTLSGIAADRYGDASAFWHLREANADRISDPNRIFAGSQIRIPLGTPL